VSDHESADPDGSRLDELSCDDCMSRIASRQVGPPGPGRRPLPPGLPGELPPRRRRRRVPYSSRNHTSGRQPRPRRLYVEHIDDGAHSGWSVLIQGTAEDVTERPGDPAAERSRNLGVQAWAPGDKPRIVRIIPAKVTGRRLTPTELGFWSDERGYL
jgi:hypothetical protein